MDFRPVIEVNSRKAVSDKKALKSLKSFLKLHKTEDGFGIDRIPPPVISNLETMINFMSSQTVIKESHINEDNIEDEECVEEKLKIKSKPSTKRKVEFTQDEDSAEIPQGKSNGVVNASKKLKKVAI